VEIDILGFYWVHSGYGTNIPDACLGPEGKRGLWIERTQRTQEGSNTFIYVVSFDQNPLQPVTVTPGGGLPELCRSAPGIGLVGTLMIPNLVSESLLDEYASARI